MKEQHNQQRSRQLHIWLWEFCVVDLRSACVTASGCHPNLFGSEQV
jgi:hypothetical protein